jgi:protein-L-isoaspartate(D-aspartate) O-methyltransferase
VPRDLLLNLTSQLNLPDGLQLQSLQAHRDFYANFVVKSAGASDERLIAAFASVERERYLGKGPWSVFVGSGYIPTVSEDPRFLYQDVVIGLATERGINNGQPSLHARCLAACAPAEGESVVHVGAGTGYYTAILATLVGATGSVVAYEIEADMADQARDNLKHIPNVRLVNASAIGAALPNADVIYVNAGATHPPASWLDALNVGGRLIFPLTTNEGLGCMLLISRRGPATYAASVMAKVAFIPCIGARDDAASTTLAAALETQSFKTVRSLQRGTQPDNTAWCIGNDWWLSIAEAA